MPNRVSPTEPRPTHHLNLIDSQGRECGLIMCKDDGTPSKFGLRRSRLQGTSLKISEGNPKYSDFELPFTPIVQETWEGGRGQEQYEKDVTKYLDAYRINTMFSGKHFLGGLSTLSKSFSTYNKKLPGSVTFIPLTPGTRRYLAVKFQAPISYSAAFNAMILKRKGSPGTLTIELCPDNSGNPGTATKTKTFVAEDFPDVMSQLYRYSISSGWSMTSSSYYWIKIYGAATDTEDNCWLVACDANVGTSKESANGSSWSASAVDLYYWLTTTANSYRMKFLEYKGATYMLVGTEGGNHDLWLNGDRGAADSNSGALTKLIDGTKAWTTDQWVGSVVWITEGPGALESQPFRKITGNNGTELTVDVAWKVTHTTSTEYVILGSEVWNSIKTNVGGEPLDYLVVNNILYLAMGGSVYIQRHREYNNAGTWTNTDWAADGTNYADRLCKVNDKTNGVTIWRATNSDVKIASAPPVTWGTNLTFTDKGQVGDTEEKIQRLYEYIDPSTGDRIPWIFKTGSVWARKGSYTDKIPLEEMRTVMSFDNAKAVLAHNVYLYFNLLFSVERYFNGVLDDVGPVSGRGLPVGRRGAIVDMVGYPGRWFAAVDGGTGYSSIFGNNGSGWHEIYRHPIAGERILSLRIAVVPGDTQPDRLWFTIGGDDVWWLPMPSNTIDPTQDPYYPYTWEGGMESSRIYAGMQNLTKLYDSIEVQADGLIPDEVYIELDYKLDDESNAWTTLPRPFEVSPQQEEPISDETSVTGRWIIVRPRLITTNKLATPIVRSIVINAVSRIPIRFGWAPNIRLVDNDTNLAGEPDDIPSAYDKLALLDEWSQGLEALRLQSLFRPFHDKRVFLEGMEFAPFFHDAERQLEGFIGSLPMNEVLSRARELELEAQGT